MSTPSVRSNCTPGGSAAMLQAEGVACERDGRRLFAPISFSVAAGDVVELLGANGAGKSTLLRALAGMNPDYVGDILFRGSPLRGADPGADVLYLGHRSGLNPQLGPDENLGWYVRLAGGGGAGRAQVEAALVRVGLPGYLGVPCGQMSAGQQRRVALARLLLARASLWLLDEPTTALDTAGVALFEAMLAAHRARGGACVVATHARIGGATHVVRIGGGDALGGPLAADGGERAGAA